MKNGEDLPDEVVDLMVIDKDLDPEVAFKEYGIKRSGKIPRDVRVGGFEAHRLQKLGRTGERNRAASLFEEHCSQAQSFN